ncbi:MAG: UDP-4-amino-4,6-dideoxy-N-acetyl-beta-L-altrosamine transaminase [Alphaproteobacteria bacterium]|nr:UDP-4-amino-4,6-dideoxy-N-acetyl-beta-L-altrosamine transaminase [Alphaproteobacteria bacterium]
MKSYGRQFIDEYDIEAVCEALHSDFLTTGPRVDAFETAFAERVNAPHAVACNSGTAALHLACMAIGLGPGDTVIVPSLTFLATANAPHYCGAKIVFADVDPQTGLMTPETFEEALDRTNGENVRAVFPVHLAGQCCDLPGITRIARARNIAVISDSCHALGTRYKGSDKNWHEAGSCFDEDIAAFSFHPVKTITTGEGGATTTRDPALAERMRALRSHGMERKEEGGPWYYEMEQPGFNYRITDFQCALGMTQLDKLGWFVEERRKLVALYDELLTPLVPFVLPPARAPNCEPAWHLYAPRIDFEHAGINRADLMNALRERGIGTQVHYIPVHRQPFYARMNKDLRLPGADTYYEHTLSLPLYPGLPNGDVRTVVRFLAELLVP